MDPLHTLLRFIILGKTKIDLKIYFEFKNIQILTYFNSLKKHTLISIF
jgi:hypothetical protein